MDSKIVAPYIIRAYVWEALKRNTDMSENQYRVDSGQGLVPIVPLGEEPEIKQFGKPYLVYGFSETQDANNSARTIGNIVFMVYANNFQKMTQVANIVGRAFEEDDSATRVNAFSSTFSGFIGIRFGDISLVSIDGGTPEDEEGGNMSAMVTLRYEHYTDYNLNLNFATWDAANQRYSRS